MPLLTRRRVLSCLGLGGLAAVTARVALPRYWRVGPPRPLEGELADWTAARLARLDLARVWDVHVHAVGLGPDTGCWVNPDWFDPFKPRRRLQYELYLGAAGIEIGPGADAAYVARLVELHGLTNPAGRMLLLAFDWHHDADGARVPEESPFHVPDEYVLRLAEEHPDVFVPCASVHPSRVDALERLQAALVRGARAVKWIPAAQGIDPADPRCDPLYDALAAAGRPLLVHCGDEHSVEVGGREDLGNPLRMRRAIERGASVVFTHCAGLGEAADTDDPAAPHRPTYELFRRLAGEFPAQVYGDLSALAFVNRANDALRDVLADTAFQSRLLYGSDYPLAAIEPLTSVWWLARQGFLAKEDVGPLRDVFDHNPMLFDLLVKASLRDPASDAAAPALGAEAFHTAERLA